MPPTVPPGASDAERYLDEHLEQQLTTAALSQQVATTIRSAPQYVVLRFLFFLSTKEELVETVETPTQTIQKELGTRLEATDAKIDTLRVEMTKLIAKTDKRIDDLRSGMNGKLSERQNESRISSGSGSLLVSLLIIVVTPGL